MDLVQSVRDSLDAIFAVKRHRERSLRGQNQNNQSRCRYDKPEMAQSPCYPWCRLRGVAVIVNGHANTINLDTTVVCSSDMPLQSTSRTLTCFERCFEARKIDHRRPSRAMMQCQALIQSREDNIVLNHNTLARHHYLHPAVCISRSHAANMSALAKSRWADDEDSPEVVAQRKREKEEKRRRKEEKQRKAEQTTASPVDQPITEAETVTNGDLERPAKRRKISIDPEEKDVADNEQDSKLLRFPAPPFGPCRDVELYELLNNIEEGSYGMVSRARTKATGDVVALKRLKMEHTNDGFPVTGLREIQTLMASRHDNIVRLREVVVDGTSKE